MMADPIPSGLQPIVERRRGRPRVPEPLSSVTTHLPTTAHDRLILLAQKQEVSVSALVRSLLILQIGQ
jgi:hypothetical protein